MNLQSILRRSAVLLTALLAAIPAFAGDSYQWGVQYLVDNSQRIFGQPQRKFPRSNRGLAISPDGKYLYAGYNHGPNGGGEVRKIAISITDDYVRATARILYGPMAKAIACDDRGRVYLANEHEILVYDAELSSLQHTISLGRCEGVAVARENRDLVMYASDRDLGTIQRFVLEEKGDDVVGAAPAGFDGTGVAKIPDAVSLRGLKLDAAGNIWVADYEGGSVFRVGKDGKTVAKLPARHAVDICFVGHRAYISRGEDRMVTVVNQSNMELVGNLALPWEELELMPVGNNRHGRLGEIVAIPGKGFFVTNEGGQTAGHRSTYGKPDEHSRVINGKLFLDADDDDNEPILRALEVHDGA